MDYVAQKIHLELVIHVIKFMVKQIKIVNSLIQMVLVKFVKIILILLEDNVNNVLKIFIL